MKLLGNRITTMIEDCNEAKKMLDDARKANSSNKYDGFFNMMRRQSIYLTAKNLRLEQPSAEALREAADAVSKQNAGNTETYSFNTIIYKQGEVGRCMYILRSGKIGTFSNYGATNELKLSEVSPVACFGEMGMLSDDPRDSTAVAEDDDTQVEIVRPEDLEELFKTSPEKINLILKSLSFRLRSITYDYFKACKEIYESSKQEDRGW
jgi:CRP-like cAMP-binding protein